MKYWRKVGLIFRKDWREEFREWHNLLATAAFTIMLVFIFSLSLNLSEQPENRLFPALFWVTVLFASTQGWARSFAREKENDVLAAVILAAGDRSILFFGKVLSNLTLLVVVELLAVPVFLVFLDFRGRMETGLFLGVLLLGSLGLALLGTFFHAMAARLRSAQLLLPLMLFPLVIPLLLGAMVCTQAAMGWGTPHVEFWMYFLVGYDLLFILIPLLLFDFVLEV